MNTAMLGAVTAVVSIVGFLATVGVAILLMIRLAGLPAASRARGLAIAGLGAELLARVVAVMGPMLAGGGSRNQMFAGIIAVSILGQVLSVAALVLLVLAVIAAVHSRPAAAAGSTPPHAGPPPPAYVQPPQHYGQQYGQQPPQQYGQHLPRP